METNDTLNQISTLTTLDTKSLIKLFDVIDYVVCDDLADDISTGKDITEVDIGIGTLIIKHTSNDVRYKFIPSTKFNDDIVHTIKTKTSPLISILENKLVVKLKDTYKDLI